MPQSNYDVNINLKTTDKTSPAAKSAGGALGFLGKAATVAGAAMVALKVATEAIKLAKFGGEVQRAADSLQFLAHGANQSSTAIVRSMKSASDGTIDRMTAMSAANKALLLGVAKTPQQFAELSKYATLLGRAMGQDAAKSIDDFVVAAGRQSKMIADNLGLMVSAEDANEKYARSHGKLADQLTDTEKKQAFLNEMLAQAKDKTAALAGSTGGLATQNEQLKAEWLDVKANAAQVWAKFVEGTGIVEALTNILWGMNNALKVLFPKVFAEPAIEAMDNVAEATQNAGQAITDILGPIRSFKESEEDLFAKEAAGLANSDEIWQIHYIRIRDAVKKNAEDQLTAMEKLMLLEYRRTEVAKENARARIDLSVEEAQAKVKAATAGNVMSLEDAIKTARGMASYGISNEDINAFLQMNSAQRNAAVNAQRDAQIRLDRAQRLQQITNSPNYVFNQTVNTQASTQNIMNDFALAQALAR